MSATEIRDYRYGLPSGGVGMATSTSLCMPFPIRPGVLAQVIVPRDMTASEADRLCGFVQSLAVSRPPPPRKT
jgi:hypothetical protein